MIFLNWRSDVCCTKAKLPNERSQHEKSIPSVNYMNVSAAVCILHNSEVGEEGVSGWCRMGKGGLLNTGLLHSRRKLLSLDIVDDMSQCSLPQAM